MTKFNFRCTTHSPPNTVRVQSLGGRKKAVFAFYVLDVILIGIWL